jgi:hypothetical protein
MSGTLIRNISHYTFTVTSIITFACHVALLYAACWRKITEGISQVTADHEASQQSRSLSKGALRCTQKRSLHTLLWYGVQYYEN